MYRKQMCKLSPPSPQLSPSITVSSLLTGFTSLLTLTASPFSIRFTTNDLRLNNAVKFKSLSGELGPAYLIR